MDSDSVTIVTGLPRSGTSMMMRMLEAGGMRVLTDNLRTADEDNPRGYYEFEPVKQIESDASWLEDAQGKVVKMVAALLKHLPPEYAYRIVFMRRRLEQVLASQRRMLERRGEPADKVSDEKMAALYRKHLQRIDDWLSDQPNVEVLYVDYGDVLADPICEAQRVSLFFDRSLDEDRMAAVVEPALHRQRSEPIPLAEPWS